jgi:hypothetical protein
MSALILFVSTGLLVYWISRVKLLLLHSGDEVIQTLEGDLRLARAVTERIAAAIPTPL